MANVPGKISGKLSSTQKEFLIFISIPLAIILIVAAVVLLPSFLAHPKYDFLYSYCPQYSCSTSYSVNGVGQLTQASGSGNTYDRPAELYYYAASNNSSRKIDYSEAYAYHLDSANVSPDGYVLTHGGGSNGGFLFWGYSDDYNNWYLKDGLKKKRVNLINGYYYDNNVSFLGWVQR